MKISSSKSSLQQLQQQHVLSSLLVVISIAIGHFTPIVAFTIPRTTTRPFIIQNNLHGLPLSLPLQQQPTTNTRKSTSTITTTTTTGLYMISNLFKGNDVTSQQQQQLPKDVKEAVSKCRAAVQKGLENKLSRMDIEFPVGTKFGVEKKGSTKKTRSGGKLANALADDDSTSSSGVTRDMLDTSDRELARLFVEMFQPLGGEHISVIFHDSNLADVAKQSWKNDASAQCQVFGLNRSKKSKKTLKFKNSKGMGMGMGMGSSNGGSKKNMGRKSKKVAFATKMNEEFDSQNSGPFQLPNGCELAIFISPTVKDLNTIQSICDQVGMGTLVILLNARLSLIDNFGSEETRTFYENEFESIFYLSIASQEAAPGCLMHRAYPHPWMVARKPKVGNPKTIATFESKPTEEECKVAYESIEVGEMERMTENVLDNVASWLN